MDARRDLLQAREVEMRLALELVRTVRGTHRYRERIHLRRRCEPHRLVRVRQHRSSRQFPEILDAGERA